MIDYAKDGAIKTVDLFKVCWKSWPNISEKVQDRGIVTMED